MALVALANDVSDAFEGGFSALFFVVTFVVAYFLLSDMRIDGQRFVIAPYKRANLIKFAVGFLFQGLFAMFMGIGYESVLSTLAQDNSFNFLNGIIIRDYRWISITIVTSFLSFAVASYYALPKLETVGFILPTVIWGILGFHMAHAVTALQFYTLFFVGAAVVLTMMIALFFESRTRFVWMTLEILIPFLFFGSMLADWFIDAFSNPYTNENNKFLGSVAPQFVYWTTKLFALLGIAVISWLQMHKREPVSGDYSSLYPYYDAVPNVVRALLASGTIAWDDKTQMYKVVDGNLAVDPVTGRPIGRSGRTLDATAQVVPNDFNAGRADRATYADMGGMTMDAPTQTELIQGSFGRARRLGSDF